MKNTSLKESLKFLLAPFLATSLIILGLIWLATPPKAVAQAVGAQVGIATRFGSFTNNTFGPAATNTNAPIVITNTQYLSFAASAPAEVPLAVDRGMNVSLVVYTSNTLNTNTLTLYFDVSPFGGTNKTSGFTSANAIYTNLGNYGGYTGPDTGAGAAPFFTWTVTLTKSNCWTLMTNISKTILDNARYIRLSGMSNSMASNAINEQVAISNVVWSIFP